MVCCDSDALGVTNTLLSFLKPDGVAIFAVPNPFHRYGIAKLIPTLQEHFYLFIRPISHSAFNGQRHDDPHSLVLTTELQHHLENRLDPDTLRFIDALLQPQGGLIHNSSLEDDLTFDLPEKDYFQWLLLIAVRRFVSEDQRVDG
jgi:hypothetical protein